MLKSTDCTRQHLNGNRESPHDDQEDYAYLITVPEETKSKCTAILDDMNQTRREIQLKYGSDMREIFACYRSQLSKNENLEEIEKVTRGNHGRQEREYITV